MESHKSEKGRVVSQNDYTQSCQIRNRNCYGCGELGHLARNWPTKKRSNNGAQLKPKSQQKCNWGQRPITGIWTDNSMVSNFKHEKKCYPEITRKISFSNLQECFSSMLSSSSEDHFSPLSYSSEDYSSLPSDSSQNYFSSASDSSEHDSLSNFSYSLKDNYFSAHGKRSENYVSSASESSDSSDVYSSPVSDLSQYVNYKDHEEIRPLRCASDRSLQIPMDTGVDSFSQIIEQVSKGSRDPEECHKAVQSIHNLSVLLLINSSFSENLNEDDLQTLQSVISNLSQCIMKSRGFSKSTDVTTFMLNKQLTAANSGKTGKDCYAPKEKEDPVGIFFLQKSAEVYQSQMANIEVKLSSRKSEIRRLRAELEMEGGKKAHAGIHEHGATETLANWNDVNFGSCPEVNIVMKRNDFGHTHAPFSQERSHWLPYLNLDSIMDDESFISHIKKYEDTVISQKNVSEEPIQKSSFNTTAHNPGQLNAKLETKKIEDHFRVLQEPRSRSDTHIEYMKDYDGNNLVEVTEYPTRIRIPIDIRDFENVDVWEENLCLESDSSWEEINLNEEDLI